MTETIYTGATFQNTGYYKYSRHDLNGVFECFIPIQANRMFFKKGEKAPILGSCEHVVGWEFIKNDS